MQKLLPYIVILFISVMLCSCKSKENMSVLDFEVPPQAATDAADTSRKTKVLNQIVIDITHEKQLEGKYIGFAGLPSRQRNYEQELLRLADTGYLLQLTSHKNPLVRIISFRALASKGYAGMKTVLKDHIEDNETYLLFAGCLVTAEPVNLNMYYDVKDRLTPAEKAHFSKLLKVQLKKYKYWAGNSQEAIL